MNRTSRLTLGLLALVVAGSVFSTGCALSNASLPELPPVPVLTITTTTVPAGNVGSPYPPPAGTPPVTLATVGGVPPLSNCTVTSGALPMGLTVGVNPADRTQCLIAGTISATEVSGTFTFTIRALDSSTPPVTDTQSYTMVVTPAFSVLPITFQQGVQGRTYTKVLPTFGGNSGALTNCTATGLPAGTGLMASASGRNCMLTGTPTAADVGTRTVTITAIDNAVPSQPPNAMASAMLTINAPLSVPVFTFNTGIVGTPFSQAVPTAGGIRPLTVCNTLAALPPGLMIAPDPANTATNVNNCLVSGTPTTAGTTSVTIMVTDSNSVDPANMAIVTAQGSANSAATNLTVNTRATTTTVSLAPSTVVVGQGSVVTVTVTDVQVGGTASSPAGTVTLTSSVGTDVFTPAASCVLAPSAANASTCTATVTPAFNGTVHTITANYPASTAHSASTGNAGLTVNTRATATTVVLNPTTVSVNQGTMVTVTVTDIDPSGTPSSPGGTIVITSSDGTDTITACTLAAAGANASSCTATLTPTDLGTGSRSVTAAYTATDNKHTSSNSNATPQILLVTARGTTTAVAINPTTVFVNQGTTVTVVVTDTDPNPTPSAPGGTIIISSGDGTDTITACTLAASGANTSQCTATLTPTMVGAGTRSITASYTATDGDHGNSNSSATPQILTVNPRTTTTTTVLNPTTVLVSQSSTVTVTVVDTAGAGTASTPVGTVTITSSVGTDVFTGTCTLAQTVVGTASCNAVMVTPAMVAGGAHSIMSSFAATDNVHANSSGNATLTVNARTTSTTVSVSPTTVLVGETSVVTVTVMDTSVSGTVSTPVGTVTVMSSVGTDVFTGTCTLAQTVVGTASCNTVMVTPQMVAGGTHTITANFVATDDIHANSNGNTALTVNPRTTATSVILKFATVFVGETNSATVTVTDTSATGTPFNPGGTITINSTVGTDVITACTLVPLGANAATCSADITPQMVAGGTHTITASYTPTDDVHTGSNSNASPQSFAVTPRTTATTVVLVPPSVAVNSSTMVMVTVTDTTPVPTPLSPGGTIAISAPGGTNTIGPCALAPAGAGVSTCSAALTPTDIGTGFRTVTAAYTATDDVHTNSDSTATPQILTVIARTTTTTVGFAPASIAIGETSTITVTVTDTSAGTAINPSGMVSIAVGAGFTDMLSAPTCTLVGMGGGVSTCTVTTTAAAPTGAHPYTATFAGDSVHSGSASAATNLNVTLRTTTTVVTSFSVNPVDINNTTTALITVTDTSGGTGSSPSGTVTVSSSVGGDVFSNPSNTCTLAAATATTSTCTVDITPVAPAGTHMITGTYSGDGGVLHSGSTSAAASLTVTLRDTTTVVTALDTATMTTSTVVVNQSVTVTVVVTDNDSGTQSSPGVGSTVTLSSSVASDNANFSGACVLAASAANQSTCTVTLTPQENNTTHTITGTFAATSVHNTSNGNDALTVNKRTTTTTLALGGTATVFVDEANSMTVTVTDTTAAGSPVTPTGNIAFTGEAGDTFGTCTLAQTVVGTATCTANVTPTQLGDGTHTIVADFNTTVAHEASQSTGQNLTVNLRTTTTTLAFTSGTVFVDQADTVTVTVTDTTGAGTASSPGVGNTITLTGEAGDAFGTCTLAAATASTSTCSTTVTPSQFGDGSHTITAMFSTTAKHSTSTSAGNNLTVNLRTTLTSVALQTPTAASGQMLNVTVTVADAAAGTASSPGVGTTVTLTGESGDAFGTCTLAAASASTSTCTATLTVGATGDGVHTVTAMFGATTKHDTSTGTSDLTVVAVQIATFTWDAATEQRTITPQSILVFGTLGANPTCTITDDQGNVLAGGLTATFTAGPNRCVITGAPQDGSGDVAGRTYVVTVSYFDDTNVPGPASQMSSSSILVFQELVFNTAAALPDAVQNGPTYTASISTGGGQPTRTLSEMTASLGNGACAGLSLDVSAGMGNGSVTGTPTGTGACNFTLQVMDTARTPSPSATVTLAFTINVSAQLNITKPTAASALVNALSGSAYAGDTFTATGGRGTPTFTLSGGNGAFDCTTDGGTTCTGTTGACAGFRLDQATGAFMHTGTPSTVGTCTFDVTATDMGNGAQTAATDTEAGRSFFVLTTFTFVVDGTAGNNQVNVINTTTDTEVAQISLTAIGANRGPHSVAVRRDGTRAYVTLETTNQLAVIDTTTSPPSLITAATLTLPAACIGPRGIAIGNTGNAKDRAYIACKGNPDGTGGNGGSGDAVEIVDVSGATPTHLRTIDLNGVAGIDLTNQAGEQPFGSDIAPDGSQVFISFSGDNEVVKITTNANVNSDTATAGANILNNNPAADVRYVAFSQNGSLTYHTDVGRDSVQIVNVNAGTTAPTLAGEILLFGGLNPERVVRDPDTGRVFVAMSGTGQVDPSDANTTMSFVLPIEANATTASKQITVGANNADRLGGVTTITFTAHPFVTGDIVSVVGMTDATMDGIFTVTVTGANTFTYSQTGEANSANQDGAVITLLIPVGTTAVTGVASPHDNTKVYLGVSDAVARLNDTSTFGSAGANITLSGAAGSVPRGMASIRIPLP